jgi:hypothetical protein
MSGIKALRRLQLGKEATAGTAIPATAVWRGPASGLEDASEFVMAEEDVGILGGTDRQYNPSLLAKVAMEETEATFEQLPYILEAGIKMVGTGATDTGGSGKVYTYGVPTNALPTIQTFTLEGGDDSAVEEMEYGYVESFKLSGKAGEAWKVSANWVGRQVSTSAFTASLTVPTVEEILFNKTYLYIDATTIGTTTKSNTLLACDIDCKTGNVYVMTGSGQKYFSHVTNHGADTEMKITFVHDATAVAEKAAWRAGTRRLIRLQSSGSALTTAGTFTYKTLRVDMTGKWLTFDKIGEQDGNDIVTGTFKCRPTSAGVGNTSFTVVNEQATIT